MEKKPLSQARIDANRANAKKSTGPRTAAGKARSSTNAVRHGYSSKNFVLATENIEEYYQMRDRYMMRLNPRDELEMNLIDMMAHASWNIYRTWSTQNALVDAQMYRMRGDLAQQYSQVPPDSGVAFAVEELAKTPALSFLARFEKSQLNQLDRASKILSSIRERFPLPPSDSVVVQAPTGASPTCIEDAGAPEADWAAASGPDPAYCETNPTPLVKPIIGELGVNLTASPATDETNPLATPPRPAPSEINTIASSERKLSSCKANPIPPTSVPDEPIADAPCAHPTAPEPISENPETNPSSSMRTAVPVLYQINTIAVSEPNSTTRKTNPTLLPGPALSMRAPNQDDGLPETILRQKRPMHYYS